MSDTREPRTVIFLLASHRFLIGMFFLGIAPFMSMCLGGDDV